jgi:hypothetical protein
MLIISLFTISHAISPTISPTSNSNFYKIICKEPLDFKDFEQRCLKLLEAYPEITLAEDYLTFTKLFLKTVAIEKSIKSSTTNERDYEQISFFSSHQRMFL